MGAKRALIVDDSKSARLFLARLLEKYELDVDNAENAESAIEYLTTNRPDVIFMDHMMPGMDGFQAVQAIKNNPRTATIPIMMYTSQEGELYLGQARALGAVGVLPKQIKQADVSKVLYQLHLVPDRRRADQSTFTPANSPSVAAESPDLAAIASAAEPEAPAVLTATALREQFAELRRALVAGVDTQTDRITAEVRALLLESLPPPPPLQGVSTPRPPVPWGWVVASVALAIALLSTTFWWRNVNQLNQVSAELTQLENAVAEQQASLAALTVVGPGGRRSDAGAQGGTLAQSLPGVGATGRLPNDAKPSVMPYPYGSEALGSTRLEAVRQLVYHLAKENATGVVDIKTYVGRFCLVGNSVDGFSLAPDETLFAKCDVVGNPAEDALPPAQRIPLALANIAGDIRHSTHGALQVQASMGNPAILAVQYPPISSDLTAGEWNRAASANNRVEIRVR
ncbi:MAG TPA: response regulator [Steroidobacteraceae bacterium]